MTYPQHWLLSFGGHQGDTEEIWNCNIRMSTEDDGPIDPVHIDNAELLNDLYKPALVAWFSRPDSLIATVCYLQWIKFNEIQGDGNYAHPNDVHEIGANTSGQAGVSNLHPLQVALVLSWRTDDVIRPPGAFGRIYSPRPCVAVDQYGDINGTARMQAATSAATLLGELDYTAPAGQGFGFLRPSIVSGVGTGQQHFIDTVVVDSSLDVQRRRSNRQSKEISSTPVVY